MKIKCVNDNRSTQLFVGEIYECVRYNENGVIVKGLCGYFNKKLFTLMDNSPIPKGKWVSDNLYDHLTINDVVENLPIICSNENLKTLTYKKIYHIDKISIGDYTISVKENDNKRMYSIWNFKKIPVDRLRSLELENLLGENNSIKKLTNDYNSYNHIEETDMVEIMFRSILDAIVYKNKVDSKVSLFNIMKKRKLRSSLYTIDDFKSLSKIDWVKFLSK